MQHTLERISSMPSRLYMTCWRRRCRSFISSSTNLRQKIPCRRILGQLKNFFWYTSLIRMSKLARMYGIGGIESMPWLAWFFRLGCFMTALGILLYWRVCPCFQPIDTHEFILLSGINILNLILFKTRADIQVKLDILGPLYIVLIFSSSPKQTAAYVNAPHPSILILSNLSQSIAWLLCILDYVSKTVDPSLWFVDTPNAFLST